MKRYMSALILSILFCAAGFCEEEKPKDLNQLFYKANAYYEQADYVKALQYYDDAMRTGVESAALYYNAGNAFFKLGKPGYAILFYEKAKTISPRDGDIKSNLAYAKSLVIDDRSGDMRRNIISDLIKRPFRDFNLNALAIAAAILYLWVIFIIAISIMNPVVFRRLAAVFILSFAAFLLSLGSFALRYYDEEFLKHGIVVQKAVECKYEPIDKSNTYYTIIEGSDVVIFKTKGDWRQVRRADGKIGWIKKDAVGEI